MTRAGILVIVIVSAQFSSASDSILSLWTRLCGSDSLTLSSSGVAVGTLVRSTAVDPVAGEIIQTTLLRAGNWMSPDTEKDSLEVSETRRYGRNGVLRSAEQRLVSASGINSWALNAKNGTWQVVQIDGGVEHVYPLQSAPPDNLGASTGMFTAVLNQTIVPGQHWTDTAFDITSRKSVITVTRCLAVGDTNNDWRCEFISHDKLTGMDERWVVDKKCRTVYQQVPPLFEAHRIWGKPVSGSSGRLASKFSVIARGRKDVSTALVLTLNTGAVLPGCVAGLYERFDGGYRVVLPYRGCSKAVFDSADKAFTVATATMQIDDSRIQRLAQSLGAQEKDLCAYVFDVVNYVYSSLKKRNTATYSNAVETLKAGFGDCGEHAVLTAALLRAAGIPARVVMGLVGTGAGVFQYHAWVAVRAEDWFFVDPAFGQDPAVNELVPLCYDDEGRSAIMLAGLIGKVHLEYQDR